MSMKIKFKVNDDFGKAIIDLKESETITEKVNFKELEFEFVFEKE